MFDWVPIQSYSYYYYQVILVVILLLLVHTYLVDFEDAISIRFNKIMCTILFFFILLYIGLRPVNGVFVDMLTYAQTFELYQDGFEFDNSGDIGFTNLIYFCSQNTSIIFFFFFCAAVYLVPIWYLSKKLFGDHWAYSFIILVGSFSFWSYGTNGIRNGMATSLFLLAFVFFKRKFILVVVLLLSISFHQSLILPALVFGLTLLNNNPKKYFIVWLVAIPLSLILGGFWENFFAGLGFGDERTSYLIDDSNATEFSSTGFRWDFLLYSASGIFAGMYFIFKKNFQDKLYNHLFNIYMMTNAFWILVIRANFSNRFAYLSWFLLGLIIIYPILKSTEIKNRNKLLGKIIFVYYIFTYTLNVILVR